MVRSSRSSYKLSVGFAAEHPDCAIYRIETIKVFDEMNTKARLLDPCLR